MSRKIDLTEPLSEDDRQYLIDRCRWADLRMNAELTGDQSVAEAVPDPATVRRVDVPVVPDLRPVNLPTGQLPPPPTGPFPPVLPGETGTPGAEAANAEEEQEQAAEPVDYRKWKVPQLKAELDRRRKDYEDAGDDEAVAEVSYDSDDLKDALVQKLVDDDAAQEDDDGESGN